MLSMPSYLSSVARRLITTDVTYAQHSADKADRTCGMGKLQKQHTTILILTLILTSTGLREFCVGYSVFQVVTTGKYRKYWVDIPASAQITTGIESMCQPIATYGQLVASTKICNYSTAPKRMVPIFTPGPDNHWSFPSWVKLLVFMVTCLTLEIEMPKIKLLKKLWWSDIEFWLSILLRGRLISMQEMYRAF